MTSRPAALAWRMTSAGASVPSEAVLWLCRSARIRATLARKLGRRRPEWRVQVLAGVTQVAQRQRLHHQHPRGVRPQHQPEPGAAHLAGERRAAPGLDIPDGKLVIGELHAARRRTGEERRARVESAKAGEPGPEPASWFLRDQHHLGRALADRVRAGQRDRAPPGARALVAGRGEASDQPALRKRPGPPAWPVRAAVVGAPPPLGVRHEGVAPRAGQYRSHFTQRYPPDRLRQIPTHWYWASPGHNDRVAEISQGNPGAVRVPCVGAVITDETGRLLLIQRGHDPGRGLWSIPGGRVEAGESDAEAVIREVAEETGLTVTCGPLLGAVERPGLAGAIADIRDYLAFI